MFSPKFTDGQAADSGAAEAGSGSEIFENSQNGHSWSLPSTPKPENYAGNEQLALFFPSIKKSIFSKMIFSQYFWDFSTHQSKDFRDLGDPAMCPCLGQRDPAACLANPRK